MFLLEQPNFLIRYYFRNLFESMNYNLHICSVLYNDGYILEYM